MIQKIHASHILRDTWIFSTKIAKTFLDFFNQDCLEIHGFFQLRLLRDPWIFSTKIAKRLKTRGSGVDTKTIIYNSYNLYKNEQFTANGSNQR
jgi:hypothetical protein